MDAFSSSIAFSTSVSVDPNRSPITFIACVIAFFIFAICSSGVIETLLHELGARTENSAACLQGQHPLGTEPRSSRRPDPIIAALRKPSGRGAAETGESNAQEKSTRARDRTVSDAQYRTTLC